MTITRQKVFHAVRPDIREEKGGKLLLVFGDLGQWLVVDRELSDFLDLFDGVRTVFEVLYTHSQRTGQARDSLENSALPLISQLAGRGILTEMPGLAVSQPEKEGLANVTYNLTNRCNLACSFCYNSGRKSDEAPVEKIIEALETGREILEPGASLIILGGEPFIRPDGLIKALKLGERLFSPRILVSTNGTLFTDSIIRGLMKRRVSIQVSLDGPDEAKNDALRGQGVFRRATGGIKKLVGSKIHVVMSMVFNQQSFRNFESYLELVARLGADEARFIPMRMIGRGADLRGSAPDLYDSFEHLLDVLDRRPEFRVLLRRDFFSIALAVCRRTAHRTGCGIGRKVIFIDADGSAYPCPNHVTHEYLCGNILGNDLKQIFMDSPSMRSVRDTLTIGNFRLCNTCPFRRWCAGDCRGEALAVYGDPLAASPHCHENAKYLKRMMWLIADNDKRLGDGSDEASRVLNH